MLVNVYSIRDICKLYHQTESRHPGHPRALKSLDSLENRLRLLPVASTRYYS
jgi:hypothetical protein